MQTAEEFVRDHVASRGGTEIAAALKGRDAAVALSTLRELQALARTKKWIQLMGSKDAAWGRSYGEAMGELLAKYMQGGKPNGT